MLDIGQEENIQVRSKKESLCAYPLPELIVLCWKERERYHLKLSKGRSPACAELFRRAFAGEQDAWSMVFIIFRPLVRSWLSNQIFSEETDDLLQDAFLSFSRYAPSRPHLLTDDDLSRVLSYLRACAQSSLSSYWRKHRLTITEIDIEDANDVPADEDISNQVELMIMLRKRLQELIETEDEEVVLRYYFGEGMKPREIIEKHNCTMDSVEQVYSIIQRLTRRIRKDNTIRELIPHLAK
jgi:RNA polymerase sigma factor (sigma-70 family)